MNDETYTGAAPRRRGAGWQAAFEAQMALWRWYRGPQGEAYLAQDYREAAKSLRPETVPLIRQLYGSERSRLIDCDPLFVSAEMCEVVEAARASFEPEALLETDLLTTHGFLYYERPFTVPDRFERSTTIQAISWRRMLSVDDPERQRLMDVAMTQLAGQVSTTGLEELAIEDGAAVPGIALTVYGATPEPLRGGLPPVLPYHVTPWFYGMAFDGNEVDEAGVPTGAAWWWRTVQVTFRLMQQRIAVRHLARPERATRREARRLRFPDWTEVVVVRLRRERGERREPGGKPANYSHRFIVSGFWRNQWYPSISDHRQVWISPYVKGDPGLPLIIRPRRVFQWER